MFGTEAAAETAVEETITLMGRKDSTSPPRSIAANDVELPFLNESRVDVEREDDAAFFWEEVAAASVSIFDCWERMLDERLLLQLIYFADVFQNYKWAWLILFDWNWIGFLVWFEKLITFSMHTSPSPRIKRNLLTLNTRQIRKKHDRLYSFKLILFIIMRFHHLPLCQFLRWEFAKWQKFCPTSH